MKIVDAIFCEDIRFELNNKLSLMGLFHDKIVFQPRGNTVTEIQWPVATNLALLLRFQIENTEKKPDQFKFEYLVDDKTLISINGEIHMEKNQTTISIALLTPQLPLKPGHMGFSIHLLEKNELVYSYKKEAAIEIVH